MKFQQFLLLFLIISSVSFGQLTFTNNPSATALAQNVVGFGVTVSNASLTCPNGARAIFANGASTTLGMTNGILLTTGTASLVANAASNGFLGLASLSVNNGTSGDALMDLLTGQGANSSFDRCKLEFDITAQCNNLTIKYKFGSEEYPEFVGTGVNDAFGFFLTGVNPAGGNYTNQNIATVPGLTIPVNIENINASTNSAYYVDNSGSPNIEYDGITTLLTASANITPCANYHLILEIADGGDGLYDSGVFLQFGGLSCKTPTITTNAVASSCTANTGSAAVNVTGVLPATYSWSPGGQTTSSITNQAAGTYTCTMTFTNGVCAPIIQTQTVTITSPGVSPTVAVSSNTPCAGATLSLTATSNGNGYGWTGPNSFSSGSQNPTIAAATTAASGIYTLVVTNAGGCSKTTTLSVTLAPPPTLTVTSGATCLGGSTTLTASGATNYTWSPGTGLSATTGSAVTANPVVTTVYTITGATGACIGTGTSTVSITGSPTVTVNSGSVCSGNSLTLTATGATNYTWSPATGLSSTTGSVVVANPGSTIVYSILGANGSCTSTASSTVNVTTTPTVSVNSGSICSVSSLALNASGATTYSWSPSSSLNTSTGSSVSANPNTTTIYAVIGANGSCTATASSTVNVTTTPTVSVNSASICSGSSATLTANGATNYTWSPATGLSATTGSVVVANPGSTIVYSILGANGSCTSTASSTVNVTTTPTVSVNSGSICSGSSLALNASGATTYSWSPSSSLNTSTGSSVSANPNATTIYAVIGANGSCTATASSTVNVTTTPTVSVNSASICSGSSTTLTANGATNYTWSPAATLSGNTGSVVIANPITTTIYSVTGANSSCTATANSTVNVTTTPTLSASSATACSGSAATLTVTGAANYTWSPSSSLSSSTGSVVTANPALTQTYSITGAVGTCTNVTTTTVNVNVTPTVSVNSASICSGSSATLTANGATNYTWSPVTNLSTSTGSVVVANPNATTVYSVLGETAGCTNSVSTTVSVTTTPTLNLTGSDICFGQSSATLTAAGATNYIWSPSGSLNTATGGTVIASPATTTSYSVLGANGSCTNTAIITVSVLPTPTVITTGNTICSGSTGSLSATGASSYTWSPTTTLSTPTGSVVQANPSVTTLYTVIGAIGSCTNMATVTMTVNITPSISATSGTICSGGTLNLTAFGATNYTWSPAASLNTSSGNVVTANPGSTQTYTVVGETAACTNSTTTTVSVTSTPTVSVNSGSICSGSSVNLTANGAGSYFWTPSATLNSSTGTVVSASPNATTTYTVIGANGSCTNSAVATVSVTTTPVVNATPNATICSGSLTSLTAFGAASYVWTPSGTLSSATGSMVSANPLVNTTYTVVGANGSCTNSAVSNVIVLADITISTAPNVAICSGQSTVIYADGGTTYHWAPLSGIANPDYSVTAVSPAVTTIYTVTVSHAGSCVKTSTIEVTVNPLPILNAGRDTSINVDNTLVLYGTGNVEVGFLNPINGPPLSCNYCYSVMVNPQENTCYTLEGVNSYGCRNTDDICVVVTKDWNIYIPNAFTPNTDQINDVFMPAGYGLKEIHMMIFDRWGVCIFKTDDGMTVGWDGKYKGTLCKEDVYVYKINFVTMSGEEKERTGHITLLPRIK